MIKSFCFIFLFAIFMGFYTTLFDFFHLINLKILNKAKIENFVFKQIKVIIPIKEVKIKRKWS